MQNINYKRLFSALNYYKLYVLIGNDQIEFAITKNQWYSEKLIHSDTSEMSINGIINNLLKIDPEINRQNLEIIVGLQYPLATIRQISISSHIPDADIASTLMRQIKKEILGKNTSIDLDLSYRQTAKDFNTQDYLVSVVRTDYLNELYDYLGDYSDNLSAIIPIPEECQTSIKPIKWTNGLPNNCKNLSVLINQYSEKNPLNHASQKSIDNVYRIFGKNLFRKFSLFSGLLLLAILLCSVVVTSTFRHKEQSIISQLSVDRGKYEAYTNLLEEERELKKRLSLINTINDVHSTHAWTIHQIERLLPKSIYLIGLEVIRSDSVLNIYTLNGSVTNEIDLYNMMAKMKTKTFIKDVVLNRTIKKNNQYSQFELELMVQ